MTADFELESLDYLLGQMEPGRRGAFEARLQQDPAAAAAFRDCADSFARFACEGAPAEPMSAIDQRVALTAIVGATTSARPLLAPVRGTVIAWSRYVWPVAAALLLGLNLVQFRRPLQPTMIDGADTRPIGSDALRRSPVTAAADAGSRERRPAGSVVGDGLAPPGRVGEHVAVSTRRGSAEAMRRLDTLGKDYAELQRSHAALRADYEAAVRLLASRASLEKTVGRIAAMELVDAASYARGERKGLLEIARGILTEPGVVVAETSPTIPVDRQSPGESMAATVGTTDAPPEATGGAAVEPYAWSVYDEKEHRGYLNVYNLPAPAADRALQLWVKPVDALTYQRVGEVPAQMQDGTGSLYYTLPEGAAAPAEILITEELRNAAPAVPTGPVVLRGP